jgi:hypothetical protein
MFGCFYVGGIITGHGLWFIPNLFATVFYGDYVNADGFFHTTWAGIALIVVLYGLLGALWAGVWSSRRRPLPVFFGVLGGLVVYYALFGIFWPRIDPVISIYAPIRQLQVAHILWGVSLHTSYRYARQLAAVPKAPVPSGDQSQDHAESVSGDVIR